MLVVAILCALAAAFFLLLWLRSKRSLEAETASLDRTTSSLAAAEATSSMLTDEVGALTAKVAEVDAEREALVSDLELSQSTAASLEAERIELDEAMKEVRADLERAQQAREAAESSLAEASTMLSTTSSALENAEHELSRQADDLHRVTLEAEAAQEALAAAEDLAAKRAETAVTPVLLANSEDGERVEVPGFSPATAWELELVRSERTWRYSVATNPLEDVSPFSDTQNPLRLAIEIEALALREDVGAFIGIKWDVGDMLDPAVDPARAHLTLRLAQEMLAAAAREIEPAELQITPDPDGEGIKMQVVPMNGDDVEFNIPPPPIASEWIDIDEHGGMVVTVKTAS